MGLAQIPPKKTIDQFILQLEIVRALQDPSLILLGKGAIYAGKKKKNDLVIHCPFQRFCFVKKKSTGYELTFPKEMTGTIYPGEGEPISLDSLRALHILPHKRYGHIFTFLPPARAVLLWGNIEVRLGFVPAPQVPSEKVEEEFLTKESWFSLVSKDQKDFWLMGLFSFLIHGLFLAYCLTIPLPPKVQQPAMADIPERFVNLIIKPKTLNPFEEKTIAEINAKIQKAINLRETDQKELPNPSTSSDPKTKKKATSSPAASKADTATSDLKANKKSSSSSAQKSTTKGSSGQGGGKSKGPSPSLVAKIPDQDLSSKAHSSSQDQTTDSSSAQLASLQTPTAIAPDSTKKKIDLHSIGILGLINSSETNQNHPDQDAQLDLLTENALQSNGESLVQQIGQATPKGVGEAELNAELNNELILDEPSSSSDGTAKKKPSPISPQKPVPDLKEKIDAQVAKSQQTDKVELPTQGDVAFQKILQIKTTGSNKQYRTPESVLQIASSYKASITHCYNKSLKSNLNLRGRVVVEFTIAANGKISEAKAISSTLNDPEAGLEECVTNMIKNWRFPPIPEGSTTVVYPFVFFPVL